MGYAASLLDFYRESPDWIKVIWALSIPVFVLGLTWIVLWYRVAMRRIEGASAKAEA